LKNSKLNKIIKNDELMIKTKEIFSKIYYKLKECYKYYCSMNPIGKFI